MRPLILLFGLPRSGTSWLGKILDSHPSTIYRHEPDARGALAEMPLLPQRSEMARFRTVAGRFVDSLPRAGGVKTRASVPVFRKDYLSAMRYCAKRTVVHTTRIASRVVGEMPVPEWVDYDRLPGAPVVWKSVESAGRFGLFGSNFPNARGILLLRHPCGHLASLFRSVDLGKAGHANNAFEDQGIVELLLRTDQARKYGLTLQHFSSMTPAERVTWRWVLMNEKAIDESADLANCKVVRYEDVCEDPIGASRELLRFAALPWAAQTEQFVRSSTSAENGAYYSIFKNPLRAANQWRVELPTQKIAEILNVLRGTAMHRYYCADT